MGDKEIIKDMYIKLCDASINKDIDSIKELLADDYILTHMTGIRQSKQDYINSVLSGELEYFESKHESIEVDIKGDTATVIGKTKTLASPYGYGKSWWNLRQDIVLKKENGTWLIKQSVASSY